MDTLPSGEFAVPATLNSKPFRLLVDTGSDSSSISSDVAEQLGIPKNFNPFGGAFLNNAATNYYSIISSISFGNLHSSAQWPFIIDPDAILMPDMNGLLGADVMSNYDIELDFLGGKMNFFAPNQCPTKTYWAGPADYAEMPITLDRASHVVVDATLDGKPVKVFLDTGSPTSIMSLDAARSLFDWDEKDPRLKYAKTIAMNGGAATPFYKFPFATLNFGGVAVLNPKIDLVPRANFNPHGRDNAEIVLGMSVIRQMHLYISYKGKQLFVTGAEVQKPGMP